MNKMIITGFRFKDNSGYHIYYVSTEINDPKGFIMCIDSDYIIVNTILYKDIDFLRILWKSNYQNNDIETLNVVHHNTDLSLDEIYKNFKENINNQKNSIIKYTIYNILKRMGHK